MAATYTAHTHRLRVQGKHTGRMYPGQCRVRDWERYVHCQGCHALAQPAEGA